MPSAVVNGQTLHYDDTGGDGPPVVFSHGFAMDRGMFDPQVAACRDEFRCVSWDQRGHGGTEDDGRPFSYWESAADLLGLLDDLRIDSATLVGLSQGAFLSMRAALSAPERVRALVILSSRAGLDAQEVTDGFAGLRAEWTANGPGNVQDFLYGMLIGDPAHQGETFRRWQDWDRDRVARSIDALTGRDDITDRVGTITVPTLVFHGEADEAIPFPVGEELAGQLGKVVRFVPVPGAGHTASLTHPELVNPQLLDFLRTYAGTGARHG